METSEQRIKIAVQKTGRLTEHSIDLLERCGLKITKSKDQLICYGENMPIDLLLVRDDDIPGLVSDDVCDLGIVGLNIVEEKRQALQNNGGEALFKQVFELDFGHGIALCLEGRTNFRLVGAHRDHAGGIPGRAAGQGTGFQTESFD